MSIPQCLQNYNPFDCLPTSFPEVPNLGITETFTYGFGKALDIATYGLEFAAYGLREGVTYIGLQENTTDGIIQWVFEPDYFAVKLSNAATPIFILVSVVGVLTLAKTAYIPLHNFYNRKKGLVTVHDHLNKAKKDLIAANKDLAATKKELNALKKSESTNSASSSKSNTSMEEAHNLALQAKQDEITKLSDDLKELQGKYETLNGEKGALQQDKDALILKIANKRTKLETALKAQADTEEAYKQFKNVDLPKKIEAAEGKVLAEQGIEKEKLRVAMQAQIDATNTEANMYADESKAAKDNIVTLETQIVSLKTQVTQLTDTLETKKQLVEEKDRAIKDKDAEIVKANAAKAAAETKLVAEQKVVRRQASIASSKTEEAEKLRELTEEHSKKIEELELEKKTLEGEKSELVANVAQLTNDLKTKSETLTQTELKSDELKLEIRKIQATVDQQNSIISERDSSISGLEDERKRLNQRIIELAQQVAELTSKVETLEKSEKELQDEILDFKKKIADFEASTERLSIAQTDLQGMKEKLENDLKKIQLELASVQAEKEQAEKLLEAASKAQKSSTFISPNRDKRPRIENLFDEKVTAQTGSTETTASLSEKKSKQLPTPVIPLEVKQNAAAQDVDQESAMQKEFQKKVAEEANLRTAKVINQVKEQQQKNPSIVGKVQPKVTTSTSKGLTALFNTPEKPANPLAQATILNSPEPSAPTTTAAETPEDMRLLLSVVNNMQPVAEKKGKKGAKASQ